MGLPSLHINSIFLILLVGLVHPFYFFNVFYSINLGMRGQELNTGLKK